MTDNEKLARWQGRIKIMTKAKEASEDLKKEAVRILGLAGMAHVNAARVVDCIVMAAMLEIADVQAAALRKEAGDE